MSKAVPAKLMGACWMWAYVANTGSGVISGYKVGQDGRLSLVNADGITARAGKKPRDLALSRDSKYLYAFYTVGGLPGALRRARVPLGTDVCGHFEVHRRFAEACTPSRRKLASSAICVLRSSFISPTPYPCPCRTDQGY